MTEKTNSEAGRENRSADFLRDSLMVILTVVFVLLYAAAFTGKFDPLKDNTMLLHIEPIIFIIIGFYLGRFPARQSEATLKEEIIRQNQKADAAQYVKEKAQQEREQLEERLKNAKTALKSILSGEAPNENINSLKSVIKILES